MAIQQGFPQTQMPMVDSGGLITVPWYQFFRALWERTGAASGAGGIVEILTGTGLAGGPANAANPNVTFTLAKIGAGKLLANVTGGLDFPIGNSLSDLIDASLGTTVGAILYRGASWLELVPGTAGFVLTTHGAGLAPTWGAAGSGTVTSISAGTGITLTPSPITTTGSVALNLDDIGSTQGDILFRGASVWSALAPGTKGQLLTSGGAAANPAWGNPPLALVGLANSTQALNNGSETIVAWDSATYDTGTFWSAGSPTVLTIPASGVGKVGIKAGIKVVGASTGVQLYVKKNASLNFTGLPSASSPGGTDATLSIAGDVPVAAADTLTLGVVVVGAGLTAGQYQTFLAVQTLSP